MKIDHVKINPTRFVDLDFNLANEPEIPTNLQGAIVRVNITYQKGDYKQDVIDRILEDINKQNPSKAFLGNIKAVGADEKREQEKLDVKMTRKELIDTYIKMYAPKQLVKQIKTVVKELAE